MIASERVRLFACYAAELEAIRDRARAGEDIPADELEQAAREVLLVIPSMEQLDQARREAGLPPVTFAPEVLEDYVAAVRTLALAVAPDEVLQ